MTAFGTPLAHKIKEAAEKKYREGGNSRIVEKVRKAQEKKRQQPK